MGLLKRKLTAYYLSPMRKTRLRVRAEKMRQRTGAPHLVEYFHQADDPYSVLAALVLPALQERYDIQIKAWSVPPPDTENAPMADALAAYARKDAELLAAQTGLTWPLADTHTDLPDGQSRRAALGHYQGAMFFYGGEWYWGLDRLHYLEARLTQLGALKDGATGPIYQPPTTPVSSGNTGAELHWYLSFRSPYTAIVRDRVKTLADTYGAELKLRFVLPMVMRGLPVPPNKKKYIPFDTAREARRLGVPFGRIMDPVGRPVELGYSLLPWAREQGRGYDFANAFLSCVWSEGVDAGSQVGLQKIVERAGLNWGEAKDIVGNDNWRAEAEANRVEMMERGIWGVPSFRVGETITWGQDRLWVIEHALQKQIKSYGES